MVEMFNATEEEVRERKITNHWNLPIQLLTFVLTPCFHFNVIHFFSSRCPCFAALRRNESKSCLFSMVNFFIDFVLTIPFIFLGATYYDLGIYIIPPIMVATVGLLHLMNGGKNFAAPFTNPRRTVIEIAPHKYKFTFLDYTLGSVFLSTIFCILYCDTSLFPYGLSKTLKGGIGTMDLGSGVILFTSGITSRMARSIP